MWTTLFKMFSKWYRGSDTEPIEEAKEQRLGKSAKIQTAYEAVMVDDLNKIAKRDREVVAAYQDHKVFGGEKKPPSSQGTGADEMIIADDIRITNIKPVGIASEILKAALIAALAYYGLGPILFPPAAQEPNNKLDIKVERVESDYNIHTKIIPPNNH